MGQALADAPRYSSYNATTASNYAYQWALSKNSNYPDYSQYSYQGGDCTNFVSQALRTGGWQYTKSRIDGDAATWYVAYNQSTKTFSNSQTWASASASGFYRRLTLYNYERSVKSTNDLYSLKPGDLVFLVRDGVAYHTMIVTGYQQKGAWWKPWEGYGPLVSYHNSTASSSYKPQRNILLTEVISKSPAATAAFAKVSS